jgi:hypothetical protein
MKIFKLYEWQKNNINNAINKKSNVIFADSIGCGKRVQSIALAKERKDDRIVIITKKDLLYYWKKSIEMVYENDIKDEDITIIKNNEKRNNNITTKFYILTFDYVMNHQDEIKNLIKNQSLIIDQNIRLKKVNNKITNVLFDVSKVANHISILINYYEYINFEERSNILKIINHSLDLSSFENNCLLEEEYLKYIIRTEKDVVLNELVNS